MTHRRLLVLCRLAVLASSACTINMGQGPAPAAPAPAPAAPAPYPNSPPPPQAMPAPPPPPPAPPNTPAPATYAPVAPAPIAPPAIAPPPVATAPNAPAPYRPAPARAVAAPITATRAPAAPVMTPAVPPAAPVVDRTSPRFLHGPPFQPTPEPRERPPEHPRGAALGMPRDLHEARADGLWVWHDERASDWHLRASTHGQARRYTGRLWLDEGAFADVRPSRSEWSDRMRASARAIEFDFPTQAGADGFEFRVANARCVHFILYTDGRPDPAAIHVGSGSSHPFGHAFTVCP